MPESPLIAAGAQVQPINAAALHSNEFFTGMWTQGNPLGPGAVPYLYQKFYSASRFERLVGGANTEITTRLTLARRPGNSVYNSNLFPPINRFFCWRGFTGNKETIRIIASVDPATGSTQGTVREVTGAPSRPGPDTNTTLWTKDPAAGRTSFVSVGNILYTGDGVNTNMLIQSKLNWAANTQYNPGDFIVDSNGNVQESIGAQTANIANIQVAGGAPGLPLSPHNLYLFLSPLTPLDIANGTSVTLAGLTLTGLGTYLNGANLSVSVPSTLQLHASVSHTIPITPYSVETGTVTTGTGISGPTMPVWQTTPGAVTLDGGQQWICKGSAAQPWGFAGPTTAPTVTQAPAPSIYPNWAATTWYAPLFVIEDPSGNLQKLTTGGITGSAIPGSWSSTVGGTTNDGSCVWTCLGPSAWQASTAYIVGNAVLVTYTYYIQVPTTTMVWNGYTYQPQTTWSQVQVTSTNLFECVAAGTSGTNQPQWNNGLNTTTQDNTVGWQNLGAPATWATFGATQTLSTATTVVDNKGNIEKIQNMGKTAAAQPTWAAQGAYTTEVVSPGLPGAQWLNAGPWATAGTNPWIYAYSGKNSITGQVSTASPLSVPITPSLGNQVVIQGLGVPNPPEDEIVLWRTLAGGSTLFYLDTFPNPGAGQSWIYTDTTPDLPTGASLGLNQQIIAPISGQNNPPPSTFVPQCYYLTRIWGFNGNILQYSNGPDQAGTAGSGDQSFSADNTFTLPSMGVKCWPTSIGLIVFTLSDIYALLGQGTTNSPFYLVTFQEGVGLAAQDAFCVNGSTAYGMLTSGQVVSMDPGAGETEVGFPIGDLFNAQYIPQNTYCAWHQGASSDMALYVADGSTGWYRMAAVAAPESGNVWSPQALITNGVKAIASLEISPGKKALLIGSSQQNQPILMRDLTTHADNTQSYPAFANVGVITLAQPGTQVGIEFVVTEEVKITGATPLKVGIITDEISGTFINLRHIVKDPPLLPYSKTIKSQRFWAAQDANTILPCRYFQQQITWATENFPNELLTNTVYGRVPEKTRR